jgi:hypothetical protein
VSAIDARRKELKIKIHGVDDSQCFRHNLEYRFALDNSSDAQINRSLSHSNWTYLAEFRAYISLSFALISSHTSLIEMASTVFVTLSAAE